MYTAIQAAKPTGNWTINTLFQPIPALFGQHGAEAGGNVIALDRFTDNLMCKFCLFPIHTAVPGTNMVLASTYSAPYPQRYPFALD